MREIKFRAWDANYSCFEHVRGLKFEKKFWAVLGEDEDEYCLDNPDTCYTLEQYTGLKDKNDTDIYEGDIVTGFDIYLDHEAISQVFIENGNTYLSGENLETGGDIVLSNFADQCEVIGNIHENPELLGD